MLREIRKKNKQRHIVIIIIINSVAMFTEVNKQNNYLLVVFWVFVFKSCWKLMRHLPDSVYSAKIGEWGGGGGGRIARFHRRKAAQSVC